MTDLDNLIPTPASIAIGGETLEISPIRVGELPGLLRCLSPFAADLIRDPVDWLALFAAHGGGLLTAVSIASRKPRDWVDRLPLDEAIQLAEVLVEVNADFFARQVAPALTRAAKRIGTTAGPAPSSASSAPATATATS